MIFGPLDRARFEVLPPREAYFSGCPLPGSCLCAALIRLVAFGEMIKTGQLAERHQCGLQQEMQ